MGTLTLAGIADPAALVRKFILSGQIKRGPSRSEILEKHRKYMAAWRAANPERARANTRRAVRAYRLRKAK